MTPAEKVERLFTLLKEGKTLYISTTLRATRVTQKHVDKWEAAGRPLFKADGKSMYMASGKKYVCIDYCKFYTQE